MASSTGRNTAITSLCRQINVNSNVGRVDVFNRSQKFLFEIPAEMADGAEMEGVEEATVPSMDDPPHGSNKDGNLIKPAISCSNPCDPGAGAVYLGTVYYVDF